MRARNESQSGAPASPPSVESLNEPNSADAGAQNAREIVLHSRFIKDMSFENTGAPVVALDRSDLRIDISVQIDVRRRDDLHEIVLTITATAVHEAEILFLVELSYAALFEMVDVDEGSCERFLFCKAPRILFPFVDRIVADVTRDRGYPPLNLTPPDWNALYSKERAGPPAPEGPSETRASAPEGAA